MNSRQKQWLRAKLKKIDEQSPPPKFIPCQEKEQIFNYQRTNIKSKIPTKLVEPSKRKLL